VADLDLFVIGSKTASVPRRKEEPMDKVVHFEIPVDDRARAKEFYRSAFDWELDDMDMGGGQMYTTVTTTPVDEQSRQPLEPGGINGGLMNRTSDLSVPVVTLGVDAIDDALKKIEAGGGSVVQPRTEIPGMGAYAYFKDSEGNVVGLWENL
jgi:uncharacterized protein